MSEPLNDTDRTVATSQSPELGDRAIHRDPVMSLNGRVLGYRIRLSQADPNAPEEEQAGYALLDYRELVGDRRAFVPVTSELLHSATQCAPDGTRLVLDFSNDLVASPQATGLAATLRSSGIGLSISNYTAATEQNALLRPGDFVFIEAEAPDLARIVHQAHASGARAIVTGATYKNHDQLLAVGADAVSGPRSQISGDVSDHSAIRPLEGQCLKVLRHLAAPSPDLAAVGEMIEVDPALTIRVLHLVNSGAYALSSPVDSARQAVVLLGPKDISSLVAAVAVESRADPQDALWFILARAMTCEALTGDPRGYTVGMLSALVDGLSASLEDVIADAGVSDAVVDALRSGRGELGLAVSAVRAFDGHDLNGELETGWSSAQVSKAYVHALGGALAVAGAVIRPLTD